MPNNPGFAAGGMLARYQAEPGSEVASIAEGRSIADGSYHRRRNQRPHSRNLTKAPWYVVVVRRRRRQSLRDLGDVGLELLPFLPEIGEQPAHPWRDVLLGILEDGGHLVAQVRRPFAEGNAALQQESANLVNERGAPMYETIAHPVQRLQIELIMADVVIPSVILFAHRSRS